MISFVNYINFIFDLIYKQRLKIKKGIQINGSIHVKGNPIVNVHEDAEIVLENNVTINSRNSGYHVALYSPVKLMADRKKAKIFIGENSRIHGSCIHATDNIKIGNNCLIAGNCNIFDSNGHELSFDNLSKRNLVTDKSDPIVINDYVWIGFNSIVMPGVNIGFGSVISAGSVVKNNIPPLSIAAGNPAKVFKTYKERDLESKKNKI